MKELITLNWGTFWSTAKQMQDRSFFCSVNSCPWVQSRVFSSYGLCKTTMEKFNFINALPIGTSTNSRQIQSQPEAGHNQPASFADMATNLNPLGPAQIPVLPPISELMPPLRQLSTMNVSVHSTPQYLHLPQLNLPQSDSPSLHPFLALSTYQPIRFDKDDSLKFYGNLRTKTAPLDEGLINTSVPAQTTQNRPALEKSVTITPPEDMSRSSIEEHLKRSVPETKKRSKQTQRSTRKRTSTKTTPQIKKKSRTSSTTSTLPSAEPPTVPAPVSVTVCSDVSSATNHSTSEQVPDSTDKWIIEAPTGEKRFRCGYPECNKSYKCRYLLVGHLVSHTGISKYKCTHRGCNECFSYGWVLKRHILTKHTSEKPFQCYLCGSRFGRNDFLKRHQKKCTGKSHSVVYKEKSPK